MTIASDPSVTGLAAAKIAAGDAKTLAKLLNITGAAVSRWGDTVPMGRILDVERVTGVPRYILRPDLFGPSAQPAPVAKKRKAA